MIDIWSTKIIVKQILIYTKFLSFPTIILALQTGMNFLNELSK